MSFVLHIHYRNLDHQPVPLPKDVHDLTKTAETSTAVKWVPVYKRL